jgi:hypothetical protein
MNFTIKERWLLAQPGTIDHPGIEWVDLRSIERVKYTPKTSNAGAQVSVYVSGNEVIVKTGYISDEAAIGDASGLADAVAAARE